MTGHSEEEIGVDIEPCTVALRRDIVTATGSVPDRPGWIVTLRSGSHHGRGEVSPLPGWSTVTASQAVQALQAWARPDGRPFEQLPPEVRAGIDAAQLTLAASIAGRPLWQVLGGSSPNVRVNHLIGRVGEAPEVVAAEVAATVEAGARVVKVKVGRGGNEALLEALASSVGPETKLRLDANRSWSVGEAGRILNRAMSVLGHHLEYVEDPVSDLDQLRRLREACRVPIAVDELSLGPLALDAVISGSLAEVVIVKPPLVGGITPSLAVTRRCRDADIDVVVSSLYDTAVGLEAWCHLAAAVGGRRAHGVGTAPLLAGAAASHLLPIGDTVTLPARVPAVELRGDRGGSCPRP